VVERDQRLGVAEPNDLDSALFCLARYSKPEHLPIEVDGALQISDLNADMVDVRSFEIDIFLSGGSRAACCQHRETLNQFSTGERAFLEAGYKIGDDRIHGDFPYLDVCIDNTIIRQSGAIGVGIPRVLSACRGVVKSVSL